MTDRIYPQFATHNAHTVAGDACDGGRTATASSSSACTAWARRCTRPCATAEGTRCRIYAPVGAHSRPAGLSGAPPAGERREFVLRPPVDRRGRARRKMIARDPFEAVAKQGPAANPAIPLPAAIFRRRPPQLRGVRHHRSGDAGRARKGEGRILRHGRAGRHRRSRARPATARSARCSTRPGPSDVVGTVTEAGAKQVGDARSRAAIAAQPAWAARPVAERAAILRRAADLYEANAAEFFALATREAGKTLADGIAEVREAVDFLRYYAAEARTPRHGTERARRHRLHLAVEFSAGDLHRPGRGGARRPAMR